MKEEITELRIRIDGLAQLTKELHKPKEDLKNPNNWRVFHPKETEKAVDSLYLAKAWLGKMLQVLGNITPYTNDGKRKDIEDIEPAADINTESVFGDKFNETPFRDKSHIEKVDWLREEIKNLPLLSTTQEECREDRALLSIYRYKVNYWNCLDTARFWLGFELQRIKANLKKKINQLEDMEDYY